MPLSVSLTSSEESQMSYSARDKWHTYSTIYGIIFYNTTFMLFLSSAVVRIAVYMLTNYMYLV